MIIKYRKKRISVWLDIIFIVFTVGWIISTHGQKASGHPISWGDIIQFLLLLALWSLASINLYKERSNK